MSSDLPNSRLGHAKRDGMLTHKPEIKVSTKEVTAATNAPATPRIRSGPSIGVLLTPKEAAHHLHVSLSLAGKGAHARRRSRLCQARQVRPLHRAGLGPVDEVAAAPVDQRAVVLAGISGQRMS